VTRRILACGGEQLLYPSLTAYALGLVTRARPKVLFVPTASGDDQGSLLSFYRAFAAADCESAHLSLFGRTVDDIDGYVRDRDLVIVGGGNTANMLAIWRLHGVDRALRAAYTDGVILSGWSAGCLCWFEAGITDSFTPELGPLRDGLALLEGSACPHYDSEGRRRPVYTAAVRDGLAPGIALEDAVIASYEDERLVEIVSARPDGQAFAVDANGERPLAVRALPPSQRMEAR
jgi:dipeptidase E